MKLCFPQIENVIKIDGTNVNEVVIENQTLFRTFIEDLNLSVNGTKGESVLSIQERPVDMSKYSQIITEFAPLQLNKKTLITKITQILEKEALNENNYLSTMELMRSVECYLNDLSLELPCEIMFTKATIGNLIKALSPEIVEEGKETIEKILDYMELVRELEREKLFILVNIRSYFNDETMEKFIETVLLHDHKILMLESQSRKRLTRTQRLTIDSDLCEF